MNVRSLLEEVGQAKRGERIPYHTGLLMRDRQYTVELNEMAAAMWELHKRGEVVLLQRRVTERDCTYYAVKV